MAQSGERVFRAVKPAHAKVLRQENPWHVQGTVRGSEVVNHKVFF